MLIRRYHLPAYYCLLIALQQAIVAQPALLSASFFGGPGDQYGYGIMVQSGAVYLGTNPARVVRYGIPPGAPTASVSFGGSVNDLTAVSGVIYGVGSAVPPNCGAIDNVGDVEAKTVFARYDLTSLNPLGCQSHNFFPYSGSESYASVVYSSPFLYAAGTGETCGFGNNSLLLSQFDLSGNLLNTVGEPGVNFSGFSCIGNSNALRMTLFNAHLYIAAFSKLSNEDGVNRPVLMKYGLDLSRLWKVRPTDNQGVFSGVTGFGGAIYAVGSAVINGTNDFLIEKYDEAGNRIWSKTSGGPGDDELFGVVGIGGRLYAVGFTTSQGAGAQDMVILEIDPTSGNTMSTTLYGGANDDVAYGAATDGNDLYVVGSSKSFATPEGNQVGQSDVVLLRYRTQVPPPVISGMPTGGCTLWPPNNKLVVVATVTATDGLGLASFDVMATSSEPPDADPDIVILGSGLQPRVVELRAERLGTGAGRTYTITATATNLGHVTTTETATCVVPHDQGDR